MSLRLFSLTLQRHREEIRCVLASERASGEKKKANSLLPLALLSFSMEEMDLRAPMRKGSRLWYPPAAELFWWEEEEGWENPSPSHRTAVLSGDGETLNCFSIVSAST